MISPADWQMKTCLRLAIITTALQLLLVFLGMAGITVPVLVQLNGFIFVAFVPGLLLLRILRIHSINPAEAAVYATGLSLFCTMLCGAMVNFLLPLFGINYPLASPSIVIALSLLNMVLAIVAWKSASRIETVRHVPRASFDIQAVLLAVLLLLLVLLGVLVLEKTGSNAALIAFIIAVAIYLCLGTFRWGIPEGAYPVAIFTISLALLYQTTLISPYPVGSDIYFEYQFYQLVSEAGRWDYTLPGTINSCLSIVTGIPIFARMMQIEGVWVLKAVYPVVFSLVPLVMYRFIRIQAGRLPAFLAVFFFMSVPTFSLELISLGRQQFAELFFSLVILLLVERKIDNAAKTVMLIVFALGVTVSHYTFGFINFVYLGALLFILLIMRSKPFIQTWSNLTKNTGGLPIALRYTGQDSLPLGRLAICFAILCVLSFTWYGLVASGSNLQFFAGTLVILLQKVGVNLQGLASFGGNASQYLVAGQGDVILSAALGLDFSQVSLQGKIFRIIQYVTQALIVAGCIRLLIKPSGLGFGREYIAFSFVSSVMLAACIFLPWFSNILNITRWYHIALITLSPFLVIGARSLWELLHWLCHKLKRTFITSANVPGHRYLYWLTIPVILPYFIFTSGLVFELSGQSDTNAIDTPYSMALSSHRLDLTGIFNQQDGAAALWLCQHTNGNPTVYTDVHARKILLFHDATQHLSIIEFKQEEMDFEEGYVFFTNWNASRDELAFTNTGRPGMREHLGLHDIPELQEAMNNGSRIYTNGGGQVYRIEAP